MDTCSGFTFYLESGVLFGFILFFVVAGILIRLGYMHVYCPKKRRKNNQHQGIGKNTNDRHNAGNAYVNGSFVSGKSWKQQGLIWLSKAEKPFEQQARQQKSLQEELRQERSRTAPLRTVLTIEKEEKETAQKRLEKY